MNIKISIILIPLKTLIYGIYVMRYNVASHVLQKMTLKEITCRLACVQGWS